MVLSYYWFGVCSKIHHFILFFWHANTKNWQNFAQKLYGFLVHDELLGLVEACLVIMVGFIMFVAPF